jgi:hypothetical protein
MIKLTTLAIAVSLFAAPAFAQDQNLAAIFEQQEAARQKAFNERLERAKIKAAEAKERSNVELQPYLDNPHLLLKKFFEAKIVANIKGGAAAIQTMQLDMVVVDKSMVGGKQAQKDCPRDAIGNVAMEGYVQVKDGTVYKVSFAPYQTIRTEPYLGLEYYDSRDPDELYYRDGKLYWGSPHKHYQKDLYDLRAEQAELKELAEVFPTSVIREYREKLLGFSATIRKDAYIVDQLGFYGQPKRYQEYRVCFTGYRFEGQP